MIEIKNVNDYLSDIRLFPQKILQDNQKMSIHFWGDVFYI